MPSLRPVVRPAALLIIVAVACTALAADRPVRIAHGRPDMIHSTEPVNHAARVDTIYLLGGPDRYDGSFETQSGIPNWNGWTHRDETYEGDDFWQITDQDPIGGQYSLWCGTYYGDDPGYGNDWLQRLVFTHTLADPAAGCVVHWQGTVHTDTEPNYDFVYLEYLQGDQWIVLQMWDDDRQWPIDETIALSAEDLGGPDGDQVQLRIRFESDGAWSDEDGLFQSDGACRVDDLTVTIDGQLIDHEDFEDQDSGRWQSYILGGVGDFAQIFTNLQDVDDCVTNYTPQVAFVDDGVVVPGTGGTPGITWRYGPGGYIVNNSGGLLGEGYYLSNVIESPVLVWPEGAEACRFEYGVYQHEELGPGSPGMFYNWGIRSTNDPVELPITAAQYQQRSFVHFGPPSYLRRSETVSDLLVPGRTQVQVSLAVREFGYIWGWIGADGTPAPYFDNVAVLAWEYGGPHLGARVIDLAGDDFPALGDLDLVDLGANSVRFDMALNIAPEDHLHNDPGDSIVIDVAVLSSGAELIRPPRMLVRVKANPLFDPYRTDLPAGFTVTPGSFPDGATLLSGYVEGDTIWGSNHQYPLENRWQFDLPDSNLLFPGDVVHYMFEAGDLLASRERWRTLPADTSDFDRFGVQTKYDPRFMMRALPTVFSDAPGDQPDLLVWNDAHGREAWQTWEFALENLGYRVGIDYDLYETRGPSSGVGNGLGGRATSAQLAGYATLVYTSGSLGRFLLGDGDPEIDPSDDLGVLTGWLGQGDKNAILTGDDLVSSTLDLGAAGGMFVNEFLAVNLVAADLRELIANQYAPLVRTIPGNGILARVEEWIVDGGCPTINSLDAIEAVGASARLAEFTDFDGDGGVYPYAAAAYHLNTASNADVIVFPYDFTLIRNAPGWTPPAGYAGVPARAIILEDMLDFLGQTVWGPPIGADTPAAGLQVAVYPNPFNPRTNVALDLPRAGRVQVSLYDVRGRHVRTLVDRALAAGHHELPWDGRSDQGAAVASGLYFVETRALGETRLDKITLVR